ncbi:MAG: amidohydrolase family protein [Spongiibacteraceae bacterium]
MGEHVDLIIRNGTVVDGTGSEPFVADVAIKDGHITAVGKITAIAAEEIDATGLLVTPGFVDVHTHYDGHVTWESRIQPSSDHGVTTIVTGNCGVGFAPCRKEDRDDLVALMAGVEDIPEVVMAEGLPWNWESFPEYLNAVAERPHDVNVAVMVPHSALRVFVMGQRAMARESASAADIEQMQQLVEEAIGAGAIGFATSRAIQQKSIRGEPIPTVRAAEEELLGILSGMQKAGSGVFQALSDFELFQDVEGEFAMFRRLVAATGRPMSFTLNQKHSDPDGWRKLLNLTEQASDAGLPIRAQVLGRPSGLLLGHDLTMSPFSGCPTYAALADKPFADRIAELRKADVRARILDEAKSGGNTGSFGHKFNYQYVYELSDPPNYEPETEQSLAAKAQRFGTTPEELAYDILMTDAGRRILLETSQNYASGSLEPSLEMMQHKDTILGLGDGGAHCGLVCDASYPTTMLSYWTRDRVRGTRLDLPTAVKALAADTAAAMGLHDRGVVAPGYKADLNVIDYNRLRLRMPEVVRDLPSGGRRIVQRAVGYVATVVNGVITYRNGQATGALPGQLVRGAQTAPVAEGVAA